MDEFIKIVNEIILQNPVGITISNPKNKDVQYKKTKIRLLGQNTYQFESFTEKQAFHENVGKDKLIQKIWEYFDSHYKQLDAICDKKSYTVKLSKKGKLLVSKSNHSCPAPIHKFTSHNRDKNYILKDGEYVPALFDLGIISSEGKVKNQGYDKFRQINRFAELIDDIVRKDNRQSYNIIDFGCGKSYLTFVLYHYMTAVANKKVNIVGLDLKQDVIEKCNTLAKKYNYSNLKFFCGDIKDYKSDFKPDMVITLHACDTATDYALYNAYLWQADYILSVPCCQHEINTATKQSKDSLFNSYGIIKERYYALATDAIRAKLLESCGYEVQLLEFIDISHSPKNLLIRAKKTGKKNHNSKKLVEQFLRSQNITQTLNNLLDG